MKRKPIKAWRSWKVWVNNEGVVYLTSTFQTTMWHPNKQLYAQCLALRSGFWGVMQNMEDHPDAPTPHIKCMCGIYGTKTKKALMKDWYMSTPLEVSIKQGSRVPCGHVRIYGKVLFTGKIIEHEAGYRAQKATIYELFVNSKLKCYPLYNLSSGLPEEYLNPEELAIRLRNTYSVDATVVTVK